MTPRPHDALFKSAFESSRDAADLLRELLPPRIAEAISWEHLSDSSGSFVDITLDDSHCDLLFSTRLRTGEPAFLYLLLEHQSTSDPAMPLRGLSYQVRIWERFRKDERGTWLPPIIAAVISHAPGGWTTPRSLAEMFDPSVMAVPGVDALVPQFSLIIDDLAHRTDEELRQRSLAAFPKLALWLLRDAHDPLRMLHSFDGWAPTMLDVLRASNGADRFPTLVTYMYWVAHLYKDELRAKIDQLDPRAKDIAMTIAEDLLMEGQIKGEIKGRMEGRMDTLRRQLLCKFKLQNLDATQETRLRTATPEVLDRYVERVLTANSMAEVFED